MQLKWINNPGVLVRLQVGLHISELGLNPRKLKLCRRTITDWTKERVTISQIGANKISSLAKISIPKGYDIIDWKEHWRKAGRVGAMTRFVRCGRVCIDEKYRKMKWNEWWRNVGQYKKPPPGFQSLVKIKIPRKSKLLAEFIGILLGDGNISPYYISITLSSKEKEYIKYICKIIEKLFRVVPKIFKHKEKKAVTIVVNRKQLVDFCQEVGFKKGNKVSNQVDIPQWIKKSKMYSYECIRGLIDTDGCFFFHNYIVNGKKYFYFKIAFTSASIPLRLSVKKILINSGFGVRMSKAGKGKGGDVRIDGGFYVKKYIKEIGSHNKKHLDKIEKWRVAPNGKVAVC
ncbi:MAG: hypothetical protein UU06_C0027G0009 [Parcubacteria group bacterium GW2011_GWB1_40_5]|nr:MAG: hypothetical protein UU06_C0027G0009 [Parcubacteria group bacterium GW2011_GWB1_40_5]